MLKLRWVYFEKNLIYLDTFLNFKRFPYSSSTVPSDLLLNLDDSTQLLSEKFHMLLLKKFGSLFLEQNS